MIIQLSNHNSTVKINTLGAELVSFYNNGRNYIWAIDEKFWNKTSPVLFPIVGRLKNDEYTFSGNRYQLPRHGFARNHEFEISSQTEKSVTFSLKESEGTLFVYPFLFELKIQYTLKDSQLEIAYSVINNSNTIMPFSLGAHPAFKIDSDFEDYSLLFEKDDVLVNHELENENFNGKTVAVPLKNHQLPLSYSLFEKDAIVLKKINSKKVTLIRQNVPYLALDFKEFPNLGIWTKPEAPFLCIEPWCGFADNTNTNGIILNKEGIIKLQPNEAFTTSFSIIIL
ncbi:MAG TPA: aldose 1-epimerase family protein [Flavobacterium sp.]|nr:aldose 1-epimerase family protein [Flavobacterium sp.]